MAEAGFAAALMAAFDEESREQLQAVDEALLRLENAPADTAALHALFRQVHTIKGSAGIIDLPALGGFCHTFEHLLDALRREPRALQPTEVCLLQRGAAHLHRLVALALSGDNPGEADLAVERLLGLWIQASLGPQTEPAPTAETPATDTRTGPSTGPAEGSARAPREEGRTLRVSAARLDSAIDLVSELVTASAALRASAEPGGQSAHGDSDRLQLVERLVEDLRGAVLQMRMVPLGDTFARMRRAARDLGDELGKQVRLDWEGGDTELDKSVMDRMVDPLMHLVRNALDHGLETPGQRLASGKNPVGRLRFWAGHDNGQVLIRIEDDGRGIDRDKVLQRARTGGLLAPDAQPTDDELLRLIFLPGFSTADTVTQVSGRGVGMDVVNEAVQALRGHIGVKSTLGQGTAITLHLPLTLAIIDGFLVRVAGAAFIVPMDRVQEVLAHSEERCIALRGRVMPVMDLREVFQLPAPAPTRQSLLVIGQDSERFGLRVDAMLGRQQTVVKSLGRLLQGVRGVSGASILGNGEVALILQATELADMASQAHSQPSIQTAPDPTP